MNRATGVRVLILGAALLVWGAAILFTSESDTWNSVGLVLGALGGLAVGTGLSLIIYPDAGEDVDVFYEPLELSADDRTYSVCEAHGVMGCAECWERLKDKVTGE